MYIIKTMQINWEITSFLKYLLLWLSNKSAPGIYKDMAPWSPEDVCFCHNVCLCILPSRQ